MQLVNNTDRDALLRPLQTVSGAVERRNTLPILANLLLRKKGNKLSLLSTDLELQIATHTECGEGDMDVATTVGARKLLDILRNMPADAKVAASLEEKRLIVQSGKSRFVLQTLAAEEFPTIAESKEYSAAFELSQKKFRYLINKVYFAMAQQDIRYCLNGTLLSVKEAGITMIATDGHRLAYCTLPNDNLPSPCEAIIPRKTVLELQRLLEDVDDPIRIEVAPNQIRFQFSNIELVSKLVEGKFPDCDRLIPAQHANHFLADREALSSGLQRVAVVTSEKIRAIRCSLSPGLLAIYATNTEKEEAHEEIPIEYNGESFEISFNVAYLLDVLSNLKEERVRISIAGPNAGALMTLPEGEDFKYVVMPMRT